MLTFDPNTSNDPNRNQNQNRGADVRDDGFQQANVVRSGVRGGANARPRSR